MPPHVVTDVLKQLRRRNAQSGAFSDLVADYHAVLTRGRELQARRPMLQHGNEWPNALSVQQSRKCLTRQCPQPLPQVRNAQLDKEASELRAENETVLRTLEEQKRGAVQGAQVRAAAACAAAAARALPSLPLTPPLAAPLCSMRRWRRGRSSCRMS